MRSWETGRPRHVLVRFGDGRKHTFPAITLRAAGWSQLLAQSELLNHGLVAFGIVFLKIVEQATPLADQHEKTAARAVIFLVRLEVFRQGTNAFAEQRDLNFGAPGVGCVGSVLVDEGFLLLSG